MQHIIHAEESPKNSAQVAAADAGDKDGQHGPEEGLMMEVRSQNPRLMEATLYYSIVSSTMSW